MTTNSIRRPSVSGILSALFLSACLAAFAAVLLMTGCTKDSTAPSSAAGVAPASPSLTTIQKVITTVATDAALAAFPKARPYVETITSAIRSAASDHPLTPQQLQDAIDEWVTPLAGSIPGLQQITAAVVNDYGKVYPRVVVAEDKVAALEGFAEVVEQAAKD